MDFQIEALYFQALESGVSHSIINERVIQPDFQNHFGGRIAARFGLCYDGWECKVQFLHYCPHTSETIKKNGLPTWGHPLKAQSFNEVYNHWRLHLGLGDLLIQRTWAVSPCLELLPFWGLRYGIIRHKLKVEYNKTLLFSMKDKFWGLGQVTGLEGLWHITPMLSLFTKGAFSYLYGWTYIHQDEKQAINLYNEWNQTQTIFEGNIGLQLSSCQFLMRLGYDFYLFPEINQLGRFTSGSMPAKFFTNQGRLSLHGLSLTFGYSF